MALDLAGLKAALQDIMDGPPPSIPTPNAAGSAWADAIGNYSITGMANGIPAVEGPGARAALAASLGAAFATLPGVPFTVASDIVSALTAYWALMVFAGQSVPPNPAAGVVALGLELTARFAEVDRTITHATKATQLSNAIHVFTGAIIATFPGPSTFPVV